MKGVTVRVRTVLIGVIGVVGIALVSFLIVHGLHSGTSASVVDVNLQKISESIDSKIKSDPIVGLSSNPYDYIQDNSYFDEIVDLGVSALPELETMLSNSGNNGLTEYIVAIAIEKITKADVNTILGVDYGWADAEEFKTEWQGIKQTVNDDVRTIIQSDQLDTAEKVSKISNYGILAVPAIDSYLSADNATQSRATGSLYATLNDLRTSYGIASSETTIINGMIVQ